MIVQCCVEKTSSCPFIRLRGGTLVFYSFEDFNGKQD